MAYGIPSVCFKWKVYYHLFHTRLEKPRKDIFNVLALDMKYFMGIQCAQSFFSKNSIAESFYLKYDAVHQIFNTFSLQYIEWIYFYCIF